MRVVKVILFGIIVTLLIISLIKYVKRIMESVKRARIAEKRLKLKMAQIRQMDIKEAEPLGKQVLLEKATLELWAGPVPSSIKQIIDRLDISVRSLFQDHKRWSFCETGTEFNSEFLVTNGVIKDGYLLGLDKSVQHKLIVKPNMPIVFELNEDNHVIGEYPSIYHYFLLAEGDL